MDVYFFLNPGGSLVVYGPGSHLRAWRSSTIGTAHELIAGTSGCCFHSPGPGEVFREDRLDQVLRGVVILEVLNRAQTIEEAVRRIARARSIVGLPWHLLVANCQHTMSWVVTGKAESFQLQGVVLLLALPLLTALAMQAFERNGHSRR